MWIKNLNERLQTTKHPEEIIGHISLTLFDTGLCDIFLDIVSKMQGNKSKMRLHQIQKASQSERNYQ